MQDISDAVDAREQPFGEAAFFEARAHLFCGRIPKIVAALGMHRRVADHREFLRTGRHIN